MVKYSFYFDKPDFREFYLSLNQASSHTFLIFRELIISFLEYSTKERNLNPTKYTRYTVDYILWSVIEPLDRFTVSPFSPLTVKR